MEAAELEVAAEEIGANESAEIADVGEIVNGRTATINAERLASGMGGRRKILDGPREGVKELQRHF
jgi:hypothetical protein